MDVAAIITAASSFLATFAGVVVSGKLTSYRIEQLEKKVDKLADISERVTLIEEQSRSTERRIETLEKDVRAALMD